MCNLKYIFKILILIIILVSCQQKTKKEKEFIVSNFNLKTDYADFKHKMTELDTLKIWINHSACISNAQERIRITKKSDSLKVRSEYYSPSYQTIPSWELVYEKTISENDTVWDFENFLVRNKERMTTETRKAGRIQIKHKNDTIHLFTNKYDFELIFDFNTTTEKLYPKYLNQIHPIAKKIEIIDDTELETE